MKAIWGGCTCSLRCRELQSQTIKDNCEERNQMTCWIGRRTFGWCREGLRIWFLLRFNSNIGRPANFEHITHKTLVFIDQKILRLYLALNWVAALSLFTFPSQCKFIGGAASHPVVWSGTESATTTALFPTFNFPTDFQLSDRRLTVRESNFQHMGLPVIRGRRYFLCSSCLCKVSF